jgi:hypothetical protein
VSIFERLKFYKSLIINGLCGFFYSITKKNDFRLANVWQNTLTRRKSFLFGHIFKHCDFPIATGVASRCDEKIALFKKNLILSIIARLLTKSQNTQFYAINEE